MSLLKIKLENGSKVIMDDEKTHKEQEKTKQLIIMTTRQQTQYIPRAPLPRPRYLPISGCEFDLDRIQQRTGHSSAQ